MQSCAMCTVQGAIYKLSCAFEFFFFLRCLWAGGWGKKGEEEGRKLQRHDRKGGRRGTTASSEGERLTYRACASPLSH
jgi:hypothetical protein